MASNLSETKIVSLAKAKQLGVDIDYFNKSFPFKIIVKKNNFLKDHYMVGFVYRNELEDKQYLLDAFKYFNKHFSKIAYSLTLFYAYIYYVREDPELYTSFDDKVALVRFNEVFTVSLSKERLHCILHMLYKLMQNQLNSSMTSDTLRQMDYIDMKAVIKFSSVLRHTKNLFVRNLKDHLIVFDVLDLTIPDSEVVPEFYALAKIFG